MMRRTFPTTLLSILAILVLAACELTPAEQKAGSNIADQLMTEEAQTATAKAPTPTPPCPQINTNFKGPVVCKFVANFVQADFSTYYTVTAYDPAGGKLTYAWTNSNPCGQFKAEDALRVQWAHPDSNDPGACPDQAIHPGTITVLITSADGAVKCEYPNGSAPGDAAQCTNQ